MKKYEFTGETKIHGVHILHRIRALIAIGTMVSPGDVGGWIESENNLSHDGDAWVCDDAWVHGNAVVRGDAVVRDNARVRGDARVYGNARVRDNALVYGSAVVCDNALVDGNAVVCCNACVYGNALVRGDARVGGNAWVGGNADVYGNAVVCGIGDYAVFKNTWSSGRWFTYTSSNKMWHVGCFYGTGDELIRKAYMDSERTGKCYEAIVKAMEAIESAKKMEADKNEEANNVR